ncbi:MAG: chemotaxis protein CheA [Thermoplasmata archaeon]|nr:chemotaxis protein CheA [Thermoplasmata archaeon]
MPEEIDLAKYSKLFVNEAREYLRSLNETMVELEKEPDDMDKVETMFRACHTIKGMAGMMGFKAITETAHALEDLLNAMNSKKVKATGNAVDVIFRGLDALEVMIISIERGEQAEEVPDLIDQLREVAKGNLRKKAAKKAPPPKEKIKKDEKEPVATRKSILFIRFARRCSFPAARAFVIMKEVSRTATIVKSVPSENDIDQELVFEELTITVEPEKGFEEMVRRIAAMHDIDEVKVGSEGEPIDKWKSVVAAKARSAQAIDTPIAQTIKVGMNKLDELLDDVSELVIARSRLVEKTTAHGDRDLADITSHIDKLTSEIQSKVLGIRMIPLETVMARFPRMVRDIAKNQGKEIEFTVDGGNIELDRTVIDKISDPIMHILRNCVDHGIESLNDRKKAKKRSRGHIRIVASKQQDHVLIEISDDGRGIDYDRIREKAVGRRLMTREEADTALARDLLDLLFQAGFSTKEEVSQVSGRGVGLDIVRKGVEDLGGSVMISSSKGAGTTFSLWLPFTLAIIDAMLVSIADQTYAVPMGTISESHRFDVSDVKKIRTREVVQLRGEVMPLIRMRTFFGIHEIEQEAELSVLVVQSRERRAALAVDDLMAHQQIVVKSLDSHLRKVRGISGGTILGSGKIALILDVDSILEA